MRGIAVVIALVVGAMAIVEETEKQNSASSWTKPPKEYTDVRFAVVHRLKSLTLMI